jgi:hypothetical protein
MLCALYLDSSTMIKIPHFSTIKYDLSTSISMLKEVI